MQFESVAAALAMDGHGVYVWTVVAVTVVITAAMLLLPGLAARRLLDEQRGLLRAETVEEERPAPTAIIEEVNNAPGS